MERTKTRPRCHHFINVGRIQMDILVKERRKLDLVTRARRTRVVGRAA